jgi:hypothetical protein
VRRRRRARDGRRLDGACRRARRDQMERLARAASPRPHLEPRRLIAAGRAPAPRSPRRSTRPPPRDRGVRHRRHRRRPPRAVRRVRRPRRPRPLPGRHRVRRRRRACSTPPPRSSGSRPRACRCSAGAATASPGSTSRDRPARRRAGRRRRRRRRGPFLAHRALGLPGGVLVSQPVEEGSIRHDSRAGSRRRAKDVRAAGSAARTSRRPCSPPRGALRTAPPSTVNLRLLEANARLAADIAVALAAPMRPRGREVRRDPAHPQDPVSDDDRSPPRAPRRERLRGPRGRRPRACPSSPTAHPRAARLPRGPRGGPLRGPAGGRLRPQLRAPLRQAVGLDVAPLLELYQRERRDAIGRDHPGAAPRPRPPRRGGRSGRRPAPPARPASAAAVGAGRRSWLFGPGSGHRSPSSSSSSAWPPGGSTASSRSPPPPPTRGRRRRAGADRPGDAPPPRRPPAVRRRRGRRGGAGPGDRARRDADRAVDIVTEPPGAEITIDGFPRARAHAAARRAGHRARGPRRPRRARRLRARRGPRRPASTAEVELTLTPLDGGPDGEAPSPRPPARVALTIVDTTWLEVYRSDARNEGERLVYTTAQPGAELRLRPAGVRLRRQRRGRAGQPRGPGPRADGRRPAPSSAARSAPDAVVARSPPPRSCGGRSAPS